MLTGLQGNFEGDGYVQYLDRGNGFTGTHMSNLPSCTLQFTILYSIKLFFKVYILLIPKNSFNHYIPRKTLYNTA